MTYFGFLLLFLVVPIGLLTVVRVWRPIAQTEPTGKAAWLALAVQVTLAVLYTTPWDNYLVAHRIWYYNPAQVSGILLGYVPFEEYIFFVLEALLVGLLWQVLAPRRKVIERFHSSSPVRLWSCATTLVLWIASLLILLGGWKPGTYLGLIIVWALPPILMQLAFGADILWQQRKLLAALVLAPGLYLSLADSLAILHRIWTIDPAQSTRVFIGALPLEEGLFFFVTVLLISFGLILSVHPASHSRLREYVRNIRAQLSRALWLPRMTDGD